jgi:Ca2+-binding EF-hand superfamily protein
VAEIANIYDVSKDKEFISGKKTKDQILTEFLDSFEGAKGNNDGVVTKKEFFDYYTDLAMSTPSDDYFVGMMESVWCMAEDEENSVFKDSIKQLIGLMRQRLLAISNNNQEEFVLRKIFKDFDTNGSGAITEDELMGMLAKLGISVERKYVSGILKELDQNKTG